MVIPYASWLAQHTPNKPLRMRRDFTRLLALIETVALLHQHQRHVQEADGLNTIQAGLEDYYLARVLVGDSFGGDAQGRNAKVAEVVDTIAHVYQEKRMAGAVDATVTVAELASALGKVQSTVRRWLKPALDHGWVEERAPAVGRKGAEYVPGKPMPDISPLPPVEELAEGFPDLAKAFSVIDPLTGEKLELEPQEVAHEVS